MVSGVGLGADEVVRQIERVLGLDEGSIENKSSSIFESTYMQTNNQLTQLTIHDVSIVATQFEQLTDLLVLQHNLTELTFNKCRFENMGAISALKVSTQLKRLELTNCNITDIEPLYALTQLNELNVGGNPIAPSDLGDLIKDLALKEIIAWKCHLTDCEFLRDCHSLETVYLNNNHIDAISPLQSLPQLKIANLRNNKINIIPPWVAAKNWIISIDNRGSKEYAHAEIGNNPITTPPIEIVKQGNAAIANYYQQLKADNNTVTSHLFEAKMLVVGEPGAGKTSLVCKIESPTASLPLDSETTKGIDVLQYNFAINGADFTNFKGDADIDGKSFRVNLWDFGGQEIYLATHRFFLSKRALYAVVSDSRKEDTDFNYWLHIVEMFGGNSPVVIILNEKDGREHQRDYSALKARFGNIQAIKSVDLSDDDYTRLEQMRHVIRHQIGQLPHIGSPLPSTWLQVRQKLEANPKNTILPHQYLAICEQCGISDNNSALTLSRYFHDIGVFLHFQDDRVLKNIIFLKPNWATNAIYQVLDDSVLFDNKGLLTKQDIINIWQDSELEQYCDEFLQLMEKFHLALKISSTNQYIVPAKLPAEAPNYSWQAGNNLYFRYQYDEFMPRGILFNLMVELQGLISSHQNVWRRGVLLHNNDAIAEVIETYSSNAIHIRISGDNQRDLLIVIMHMLDKVNSQYHNLKVEKKVPCNCSECKPSQSPHFYSYSHLLNAKQKGADKIQCMKSFESVDVNALLNTFSNATKDQPDAQHYQHYLEPQTCPPPVTRDQIFISYSHQDKAVFERVCTHFKAANNIGLELKVWEDTQINAGDQCFEAIKNNLARAKVAVLLLSTDFFASDFINQQELPDIINAMKQEGATIISLIIGPCIVDKHKVLSSIQCVNSLDNALSGLNDHQRAQMLVKLVEAVEKAMKK